MEFNKISLDTMCAAICEVMGINPPEFAAPANKDITSLCRKAFDGRKADRVFIYNPDAIAEWVYKKYPNLVKEVMERTELEVPYITAAPPATPVCFGTMYTGAQPKVHGIEVYARPVIKIETLFDAVIKGGKKCAIVSTEVNSMSLIFLEREMDYFIMKSVEEANAKAAQLILEDNYDVLIVYNGNYDFKMHRFGPESIDALSELRANSETFAMFDSMICEHWKHHDTFMGFCMDHGCHEVESGCGTHGFAKMPEDMNIMHSYAAHPKSE